MKREEENQFENTFNDYEALEALDEIDEPTVSEPTVPVDTAAFQ